MKEPWGRRKRFNEWGKRTQRWMISFICVFETLDTSFLKAEHPGLEKCFSLSFPSISWTHSSRTQVAALLAAFIMWCLYFPVTGSLNSPGCTHTTKQPRLLFPPMPSWLLLSSRTLPAVCREDLPSLKKSSLKGIPLLLPNMERVTVGL